MNIAVKVDQLSRFALSPSLWDASADEWARSIPHDNPGNVAEVVANAVRSGLARLFYVEREGARVGAVVCEFDAAAGELIVIAAHGRDREKLTQTYFDLVEDLARKSGCKSVRFHTMRPGLVRRALSAGWRASEIVMRKALL